MAISSVAEMLLLLYHIERNCSNKTMQRRLGAQEKNFEKSVDKRGV